MAVSRNGTACATVSRVAWWPVADVCTCGTRRELFCQHIRLGNTGALRRHAQTIVGEIRAGRDSPRSIAHEAYQQHRTWR